MLRVSVRNYTGLGIQQSLPQSAIAAEFYRREASTPALNRYWRELCLSMSRYTATVIPRLLLAFQILVEFVGA